MPSVAELFDRVGAQLEEPMGGFFRGCARSMETVTGRPPQTAMRLRLEQEPLSREEANLLLELAGCLGRYDLQGQARALELYKSRLDGMIAANQEIFRRKSRAWMTASVCAGLALIVVLL